MLPAIPIESDVFAIPVTKRNFVYAIIEETITLIDSGPYFPGSFSIIKKALESVGIDNKNIDCLLLTHHDLDHVGNAAMLQKESGCRVYISRRDMPYVTGEQKRPGVKRFFEIINSVIELENLLAYDEYQMGNFRIIPTPGHTPGHVCICYRNILFCGDLVLIKNGFLAYHPDFLTWNKEQLLESTKKIASIPFKWLCPGDSAPIKVDSIRNPRFFGAKQK